MQVEKAGGVSLMEFEKLSLESQRLQDRADEASQKLQRLVVDMQRAVHARFPSLGIFLTTAAMVMLLEKLVQWNAREATIKLRGSPQCSHCQRWLHQAPNARCSDEVCAAFVKGCIAQCRSRRI